MLCLTVDELLENRDSFLRLEEVEMGSKVPKEFKPVTLGHGLILNLKDRTTYRVECNKDHTCHLVREERLGAFAEDILGTVCVDGKVLCHCKETRVLPSLIRRIYQCDTGKWTDHDIVTKTDSGEVPGLLDVVVLEGRALLSTRGGNWLLDSDTLEYAQLPEAQISADAHVFSPIPVGDSVVYGIMTEHGEEVYPSYSTVNGWDMTFQRSLPEGYWGLCHIPLGNCTLSIGYDALDAESQCGIGYLDAVSGQFVKCCDCDFDCRLGADLGGGRYLVQCYRGSEKGSGWYILHLDPSMLQETGGVLTQDIFD
ncbi:hypothetical protein KIPB_000066 [Kipferlia bialata]|uniref:Uncharacterized protein n=1 Tax=Kipferlia bialata TaxID=797122 RepID=A0A9K3GEM6_9EUKA|nr:hypothetical protein KIPB_000066 [Kipferlia bialata]|eukprot:g66.t1